MNNREFYVETPLGQLHVYAKHQKDCPADFPGVFVELMADKCTDGVLLSCTEYDPCEARLQTCVYDYDPEDPQDADEPVAVVSHVKGDEQA